MFDPATGPCAEIKSTKSVRTRPTLHAKRIGPTLTADRARVVIRALRPTTDDISRRIIGRVMALSEEQVAKLLNQVINEFADRHEQVEGTFPKRFNEVMRPRAERGVHLRRITAGTRADNNGDTPLRIVAIPVCGFRWEICLGIILFHGGKVSVDPANRRSC
jgi:hypothetical protein